MSVAAAGSGAAAGAAVGSTILPPFGTAAGAVIGSVAGIFSSRRSDREKARAALVEIQSWLAQNGVDATRLAMSGPTRAVNTAQLIELHDVYAAEAFRRLLQKSKQSSVNIPSNDLRAEIESIRASGWRPTTTFVDTTAGGTVAGVADSGLKMLPLFAVAAIVLLIILK